MIAVYIFVIIVQVGVIVYFVRKNRKQNASQISIDKDAKDTTYEGLRNMALMVTPAQLKLTIPSTETLVYGVVMDCNVGELIITLSAYITGAINMYFSTGGGKIGGGLSPDAAEVAVDFVTTTQQFLARAIKVNTTDPPVAGCARFYLLTNKGIYVAQEQLSFLENSSSPWLAVFKKGNDIINLLHNSSNGETAH